VKMLSSSSPLERSEAFLFRVMRAILRGLNILDPGCGCSMLLTNSFSRAQFSKRTNIEY